MAMTPEIDDFLKEVTIVFPVRGREIRKSLEAAEQRIKELDADRDRLAGEVERLREALEQVRDRGIGTGAAVVVSMTTLRAIAKQALAAEASKPGPASEESDG